MGEEKERNCTDDGKWRKEGKEMENFSSKNKSPLLCVHAMMLRRGGSEKERE